MARKGKAGKDTLKLTPQEAESMGVEWGGAGRAAIPKALRDLPLHEQVVGALAEEDMVEALTGEDTPENREDVEEAMGDRQEEGAEGEGQ